MRGRAVVGELLRLDDTLVLSKFGATSKIVSVLSRRKGWQVTLRSMKCESDVPYSLATMFQNLAAHRARYVTSIHEAGPLLPARLTGVAGKQVQSVQRASPVWLESSYADITWNQGDWQSAQSCLWRYLAGCTSITGQVFAATLLLCCQPLPLSDLQAINFRG